MEQCFRAVLLLLRSCFQQPIHNAVKCCGLVRRKIEVVEHVGQIDQCARDVFLFSVTTCKDYKFVAGIVKVKDCVCDCLDVSFADVAGKVPVLWGEK